MKGKVKTLVLIGESADEFSKLFSPFNCVRAGSLDEAVVKAMRGSAAGDTIILSPACASYDMFKNFEDRGERFRESVQKLQAGGLAWI
jgi:UDP-N-acetylmuramoylalanine--D-glutamate ligase